MKPQRLLPAIASMSVLVVALVLFCPTSLVFSQAEPVDDATCLGCHDGLDLSLRPTIHRLSSETQTTSPTIACVSCHEGAATHIEEPSRDNIGNPSRMSGFDALALCSNCHVPHPEMNAFGRNAHDLQRYTCSTCHTVHAGKNSLLRDDQALFCLDCHTTVQSELARRSAHPVRQQNVTCLSCHRMVQSGDHPEAYAINRTCEDCHSDVSGPYMFDHEAVHGWSAEGSGCGDCHNPHGSSFDKLLRQSMNELCRECHAVPGHAFAPADVPAHQAVVPDGDFTRMNCITCHSDVHGSNTHELLLDDDLPARLGVGCQCHGLPLGGVE